MSSSDESDEIGTTPPILKSEAASVRQNLLPAKSKKKYNRTYDQFMLWRANKNGPFKLTVTNFEVCFGPKTKNCTALEANVTGDTTIFLNLRVIKNCVPSKGKIVASSSGKDLVRLHMNKPCDHLFLKPLLMAMYNISEQCMFLKGDYSRKVDIGTIADNYFGGSFFYGNITFKANFYNDECNFSCTTIQVTLSPK